MDPLYSEIRPESLTWCQALDIVNQEDGIAGRLIIEGKGKWNKRKVAALLTKLDDLETPYRQLSRLEDDKKAPLLKLIAKTQRRAFKSQRVGKLSLARRPLTLRQWKTYRQMTSGKQWFFKRWSYRIRLLFTGYGLYLRSRNITPSTDLRNQLARWANLSSEGIKPKFLTLQNHLKGLPTPDTKGIKKANVTNPFELSIAIEKGSVDAVETLLKKDSKLVNRPDYEGKLPLEIALEQSYSIQAGQNWVAISKLLIEKGADLTKITSRGYPISDAIYLSKNAELTQLLAD
ncbi:MAG: hypothetical protein KDK65_06960, partial [Chlamydiia bacterium]|nr:hypothetical protein [Chlamydiia bacterium]